MRTHLMFVTLGPASVTEGSEVRLAVGIEHRLFRMRTRLVWRQRDLSVADWTAPPRHDPGTVV
jgi:hypothetical protein